MDPASEPAIQTASIRSQLERVREPLDDWSPTIEMTQRVQLPSLPGDGQAPAALTGDYLFENIPAMIWIKDTGNRIIKANRWAAKAMGRSADQLAGRLESELQPDRADAHFADDRRVISSKQPIYGIVEQFQLGAGEDLWVVTDKLPILDHEGEVQGIVVITRDISNQKEAESKLVQSQLRLELALWGAGMGSWDLSLESERLDLDERAARLLGCAESGIEIHFDAFLELVSPADLAGLSQGLKSHLENTAPAFECEWRAAASGGAARWILQRGRIVEWDTGGNPLRLSGTIQDVTKRRQMEDEHVALEKQMQHTQKLESLGVLAGGIAHDFNNLLTGILSQSGIARVELAKGSKEIDDHLQKIEAAAQRMAQLTRQMLAYSGRGKFEIRRFDLNEVIDEIVFLLKASIRKTANYEMELSEIPPYIEGDPTQIHQVILNLVTNASDAIGDRPGKIHMRTGFADLGPEALNGVPWGDELAPGRFCYVEVEDNGCGMDAQTQARLFEPFFTTKFTGRGLGMSAVLGIVRSHGGLVKVETAPGVGTTFRVYTPAADPPEATEAPAEVPVARVSPEGGRFLIVDDEAVVRSVFSQAISALGYEHEQADDGPEAIELFRKRQVAGGGQERFRGVFLDMTMPKMNGHEVYLALREIDPAVAVCIMSGFAAEEIASRFESEKVAAFLAKPFRLGDIQEAIAKMCELA